MQSFLRLFAVLTLLVMLVPDTSAQVSVRRRSSSSSKSKTEKTVKADPKPAKTVREELKSVEIAEPATTAQPATAQPVVEPKTIVPTKRTNKKTGTQPSEVAEGMTLRQQAFAEYQRQEPQYVPWQHVVYRELDMNVGDNATLYYPVEPTEGMTNLFRVLLDAICKGQLKAYEYMDGREIFSEKYLLNVESMLQKFDINYQSQTAAGRTTYVVAEEDVPCNEVMSYYLKERWQYDLTNSRYSAKVLAICPILHRVGEFGESVPYPMCWIDFEDLRPFLRGHMVMLDGMNNAPRLTMEEYFTLNKYKGELYKVQNTRGLNLMQQYPDPDSLSVARARIEAELRGFKDSLWIHEPTAAEIAAQDSVKDVKRAEKKEKRNRRTKEVVEAGEETPSKGHSARRTR